jgi:hypothetical protein
MRRMLQKINGGVHHVLRERAQGGIGLQGIRSVDVGEQSGKQQTVVIVSHASAVIKLSCCIPQRSEGYPRISRAFWPSKQSQLCHANCQVAFVELVRDVPALWPEGTTLLRRRVKGLVSGRY